MRAIAPAVSGFQGLAFLRGAMIAAAPRGAMAAVDARIDMRRPAPPMAAPKTRAAGRDIPCLRLIRELREVGLP